MPSSLEDLTPLTQRLARNGRRIAAALDQLPTIVQQLVAAFERRDQRSLKELSHLLARSAVGQPVLSDIALELGAHVESRQELPLQRSLLALVGEVGALRRRGVVPAVALPTSAAH